MKSIHVILVGLAIFNAMLVITNLIGVFNYGGPLYEGKNITGIDPEGNVSLTDATMSAESLFDIINPFAVGATFLVIIVAAVIAWKLNSPVPLGAGALCAIYTGIWIQTYGTLEQFPIPSYILGLGTLGIGLIFMIDIATIMAGRQDG